MPMSCGRVAAVERVDDVVRREWRLSCCSGRPSGLSPLKTRQSCCAARVGPKPGLAGPARTVHGPARPGKFGTARVFLRCPDVCFFFPHYFFVRQKTRFFPPGAFGARFIMPQENNNTWLNILLCRLFCFTLKQKDVFEKKCFLFQKNKNQP